MAKVAKLVPLLLLVLNTNQTVRGHAPNDTNLVRVALGKVTTMQAGDLGQPISSYFANIGVGTPPKSFKFLVDINAREIWLPHYMKLGVIFNRLNYKAGYCKKDSSSGAKEVQTYTIEYRACELSGKAYRDVFEFENVTESLKSVRFEQRFLAISSASNDRIGRLGIDGVISLNPWPISETGSDLITVGMSRAGLTSELKFSLLLDPNPDSSYGGELALGAVDASKFVGSLRYHKGIGQHQWELNLQSVMLGGNVVSCLEGNCSAVLATSHNDIYGPASDVQQVLKLLGFAQVDTEGLKEDRLYEIDCLKVASLPPLTFIIDGAYYVIHPLSYIKKKVDGVVFKSSTCYVSILSNGSKNRWDLGTNFVSNYYTVFDVNLRQVAFGVRK